MENKEIYIVVQDSVYDFDSEITIEGFINYDDATDRVKEILEQDKEENPSWYDGNGYVFEECESQFEVYEDGSYCENHFVVYIKPITLK